MSDYQRESEAVGIWSWSISLGLFHDSHRRPCGLSSTCPTTTVSSRLLILAPRLHNARSVAYELLWWRQLCPGRTFAIGPLLSALFGSLRKGTDNCGLAAQQALTPALQCQKWYLRRTVACHAAYHSFDLECSAVSVAEAKVVLLNLLPTP